MLSDWYTGYYLGLNAFKRIGTGTSAFVVIAATSGDIYNIGGISGEPTTNIVFTLWENKAYGKGK